MSALAVPVAAPARGSVPQLLVDPAAIAANVRRAAAVSGSPVMAVVKADGFGAGADRKSTRLNSSHSSPSRMPSSA